MLSNIAEQLLHFGLDSTRFDQRLALDAAGTPYLEPLGTDHGKILDAVETLAIASVLAGIGWSLWSFRALRREERVMLLLIAAGIVGNAIICAVFSGVADRYQARVIWVFPVACMAILLGARNGSERELRH
jgi:fucose permease